MADNRTRKLNPSHVNFAWPSQGAHLRQVSTLVKFIWSHTEAFALGHRDIQIVNGFTVILAETTLSAECNNSRMNTGKRPPMAGEVLEITEATQHKYSHRM
jgi:hypothetical protein